MNDTAVAHRRLSTLRRTYPGWNIVRGTDEHGHECWGARLRRPITAPMRAAGVVEVIRRPDAFSLGSALACQAKLVHACPPGATTSAVSIPT
ncbi:hypothetical protein [Nonomuraea sp. NPDC050643]|uniref:hypothetical protein n=1 Tax=Nonomuraea sp. NPDC050643 TaxID=3155660 RepID=UPI0033C96B57